jgi:hypothetical protein
MSWLDYGQNLNVSGTDTSQTVSGLDIGAADANRWVLVGITGIPNSATAATSVTVGGVTATAMAALGVSGGGSAGFYKAQVPTGTTADVVVNYNGTVFASNIAVARFIGEPLFDEAGTDTAVNASNQLTTPTLTVPDNGYVYGLTSWFNVSTSASWPVLTEDFEDVASNVHFSGASGFFASAASGSLAVEFGANPTNNDVLLVVVFTLDDVPSGETFDRAAAIASTSSLTASAQVTTTFSRAASIGSASALTSSASVTTTFPRAAAISAASGLTASATVTTTFQRAAAIASTSSLTASATVTTTFARAAAIAGASTLTASAGVTRFRAVAIGGQSSVSASATVTTEFSRAAAIAGASTATASAGVTRPRSVAIGGQSSVSASATVTTTFARSASITAASTLTAVRSAAQQRTVSISAVSSFSAASSGGTRTARFDPDKTGADITLSGSNDETATTNDIGPAFSQVDAGPSVSGSRAYVEFVIDDLGTGGTPGLFGVGFFNRAENWDTGVGIATGISLRLDGNIYDLFSFFGSTGGALSQGEVLGFVIDTFTGDVWASRNGTWIIADPSQAAAASAASGAVYPTVIALSGSPVGAQVTLRLQREEFDYAVPAGCLAYYATEYERAAEIGATSSMSVSASVTTTFARAVAIASASEITVQAPSTTYARSVEISGVSSVAAARARTLARQASILSTSTFNATLVGDFFEDFEVEDISDLLQTWTGAQLDGGGTVEITTDQANTGTRSMECNAPNNIGKAHIFKAGYWANYGDTTDVEAHFYFPSGQDLNNVYLMDWESKSFWSDENEDPNPNPGIRIAYRTSPNRILVERGKLEQTEEPEFAALYTWPTDEWVKVRWVMQLGLGSEGNTQVYVNDVLVIDTTGTTYLDEDAATANGVLFNEEYAYDRFKVGITANSSSNAVQLYVDDVSVATRGVTFERQASIVATSAVTVSLETNKARVVSISASSGMTAVANVDAAPTLVISTDDTIQPSPKLGLAFPFDPANRAQAIADDGFGYVRIGASWNLIQPDASTWNWAGLDSRVQAIVDAGMEPFLTFASDAAWATSPGDDNSLNDMPDDLADWTAFVGAVADRYDGVVRFYQFANEFAGIDNGSGGWSSTKENLVAYVNAGYAAVKANASGTTVFMGGVASFNLDLSLVNAEILDGDVVQALSETTSFGFTEEEARSPEADALIAGRFTYPVQNVTVDGFSAHLYGNRANDEARIQFLADATGADLFISTESGAPTWTGTAPTDEAYFTEAVLSTLGALAAGLEVVFWFQDYEGGATFYNQHVPLRDDELNPKPNLWGLKTIARHLVGGSRVTKLGDDAYLIRGPASAYIGNWDTIEGSSKFSGITPARTWVLTDYESGTFTERTLLASEFALIEANVREARISATSGVSVTASVNTNIQRAAQVSASSNLDATATRRVSRATGIGAASGVSAAAKITRNRSASIAATSSVSTVYTIEGVIMRSVAFAATSTVAANANRTLKRAASITSESGLAAQGERITSRNAAISAQSSVSAEATRTFARSVVIEAQSVVEATQKASLSRQCAIFATSSIVVLSSYDSRRRVEIPANSANGGRLLSQPNGGRIMRG